MGVDPAEEDLVVLLLDLNLVDELELRDEGSSPQVLLLVQIGHVANHEVPAVELDRVALLDETLQVFVTTDQFVKH